MSDKPTTSGAPPFAFVNEDLKNQIDATRAILTEADNLSRALEKITDPELKAQIAGTIRSLVQTANNMTSNVVSTSGSAVSSASSVAFAPRKWPR